VDTASGHIGTDGSTATTGDGAGFGGPGGEFSGGGKQIAVLDVWHKIRQLKIKKGGGGMLEL